MPRILYILPVLAVLAVLPAAHAQTPDNTPPTVSSFTIFTNGTAVVEFSELIDADSFDPTDTDDLRAFQRGTWYTPAWNPMTVDASIITGTLDNVPSSSQFLLGVIAFGTVKDLAGNSNDFKNNIPVSLRGSPPPDTTPPSLVSATLDKDTGVLTLRFDEAVDVSAIVYAQTLVRGNTDVSLQPSALSGGDSDTLVFEHPPAYWTVVGYDSGLVLTLGAGSVSDLVGNGIAATTHDVSILDPNPPIDTTPPSIVSATYETATGTLTIVFSETLDVSKADPTGISLGPAGHTLADHSDFDGTGPDSDTIAVRMSSDFRDGFEPAADTARLVILHHAVVDLNGNSNDSMLIFEIPVHAGGGQGSSKDHLKKPTFGTYELTHEQAVSCGYSMDGVCRDVTDWHVDYERDVIRVNSTHDFALKAYSPIGYLAQFQLAFGVPEVGSSISQAEAVIIVDLARNYTDPSTYQVAGVSYLNENSVIGEDATIYLDLTECTTGFEGDCLRVSIDGVLFRERMHHEPFAIFAMDRDRRTATHYMNEGILVEGESLNPAPQETVGIKQHCNQHAAALIELVRTDKLGDLWEDQWGSIWTRNGHGTWLQITRETPERVQDGEWSVMTRLHSDFGTLVQSERDRALLVFDSSYIQSWPEPAFAHEIPEGAHGDGARLAGLEEAIISEQQRAQDLLDRMGPPPA